MLRFKPALTNLLRRSKLLQFAASFGALLCCGAAPSMSLADVPQDEHGPSVVSPAIGVLVQDEQYPNTPAVGWMDIVEGKRSCFWGEGPAGMQRSEVGERTERPPFFCARLVAGADEIGWSGHEAKGDHAKSVGNYVEAEKAYTMAVGLLDRTSDKEVNQDLAALLNKLGAMRFKQNDFAGAETAFRRALNIYTLTRGADDLHVADTLDLLARALFEQREGRVLAGPLFYRAWVIRAATLSPDHPAIADSLHHIAVSLYPDNLSVAMPLILRSKEIREKVFGHDHTLVASSLDAMARLYEAHSQRDLAIPLYQEALTIQEKVFGLHAAETLQARSNLEMAHRGSDDSEGDSNASK